MNMTRSISTSQVVGADKAQRAGERRTGWLLLTPAFVLMNIVGFFPMVYSLYVSLTDYNPTHGGIARFVGLKNYASAVLDLQFWHAVGLTCVFVTLSVVSSLVLAVLLSLLFNLRYPGFFLLRTIILIPMLITPIAVGIVWRVMMMPDLGVLNYLLSIVGLQPQLWTSSASTALLSIILVDIWQWTPFMFLIVFAGISSLPKSPFEAAAIDGAGPIRVFFSITLPLLRPVIVIATLLRIVDAFRTYDTAFIMTRGGPDFATDLVSVYLQRVNFRFFDLGYGAALSWITLLIVTVIILIFTKLSGFTRIISEKEDR
ncbi:carbohydrate ABC transporter permease [Rhizobium ruizarguesonis]|uniref:carbohydrate ABC transporter permease n=1 Tax=Rhizobium ruizarguesonis TaxID=2081791 RepID=UPI00040BBE56|nr:sugar ABC transporter permease [Rhizobium ruizarguesonis]MBY5851578.1 sugar ABC transporter permease [Rhizobium leguminosarum]QND24205.1 sugar ABC transporter permease [Rhizobium leguminosarum bv. viciae]MBY5873419.1 sugar ABC transporter permease [Rhizobium leguminosarum]MBY5892437.1 sugar ABC transporter permease [Rhizobium leguminosarum]NEH38222.1 ABC transporter permease subunit [Rhizobium ruizarguesonis]